MLIRLRREGFLLIHVDLNRTETADRNGRIVPASQPISNSASPIDLTLFSLIAVELDPPYSAISNTSFLQLHTNLNLHH